ncbi:MAG: cytochrome c3 family protein [Roseiflexaceae bacterium]
MAQIFPRSANALARISIIGGVLLAVMGIAALYYFTQSNWARQVGPDHAIPQPVAFSHQFHAGGLRIDCRYCHNQVEVSAYANVPATETCMSCHSVVRLDSEKLAPVRESYTEDKPIEWNKVHDLPKFVHFNHSIHVSKGVGCSTCHGNVRGMGYTEGVGGVYKVQGLYMGWCLSCHRNPAPNLRPLDQIYNTEWEPPANQLEIGARLVEEYRIRGANQLTNCSICHY